MAKSKHREIRDALISALGAASIPAQPGRTAPMAEQDQQLVRVYLDQTNLLDRGLAGQPQDWATRLRVECLARGTASVPGEDAADDLLTQVYALAQSAPGVLALVMDVEPVAMAWSVDEAETSLGVAQLVLQARHRTPSAAIAA